jgi:hypothetical protein
VVRKRKLVWIIFLEFLFKVVMDVCGRHTVLIFLVYNDILQMGFGLVLVVVGFFDLHDGSLVFRNDIVLYNVLRQNDHSHNFLVAYVTLHMQKDLNLFDDDFWLLRLPNYEIRHYYDSKISPLKKKIFGK